MMVPNSLFTSTFFQSVGIVSLIALGTADLTSLHRTVVVVIVGVSLFAAGYTAKQYRDDTRHHRDVTDKGDVCL